MWFLEEAGDWNLPADLVGQTTQVWRFVWNARSVARVGLMRPELFSPPVLWLEILHLDRTALRAVSGAMRDLHCLTGERILKAEVVRGDTVGARFAVFAGFTLTHNLSDRHIFRREQ